MVTGDVVKTGTRLYGSYADFNTHRDEDSLGGTDGDQQLEWYAGVEETAGPLYLEASYFYRDWKDRSVTEEHTIADVHIATLGGRGDVSFGFDSRLEDFGHATSDLDRYYLGFSLSPHGAVTARYARDDKSSVGAEEFWGGGRVLSDPRDHPRPVRGQRSRRLVCSAASAGSSRPSRVRARCVAVLRIAVAIKTGVSISVLESQKDIPARRFNHRLLWGSPLSFERAH
jgi:hypothetical protein